MRLVPACTFWLCFLAIADLLGQNVNPEEIQDLYGHSVQVAEATIRQFPGDAQPVFDLGETHQNFQFDDRAIEAYRLGLRMDPSRTEYLPKIGFMLSQKNLLDEAIQAFRERLRISPRDPDLHTRIGLVLFHQGRLAEAAEEFRKEIQNRTAGVMTYLILGHALRDLRMLPEALRSYKEAIRMSPEEEKGSEFTGAWYGISQVYKIMGNREEELKALEVYQKWKTKDDDSLRETLAKKGGNRGQQLQLTAQAYLDAAETYLSKGRMQEAEQALRNAFAFAPPMVGIQRLLVDILRQQGRLDEALAEGQKLVASSRSVDCLYLVAGLLLEKKRFGDAAKLLEEAVEKKPPDGDAYRELARLILGEKVRGEPRRALELAQMAVERSPTNATNWDMYGWGLLKSGDLPSALEAVKIALRLDPTDENRIKRYEELSKGRKP